HPGEEYDDLRGGDAKAVEQPLKLRLGQVLELALAECHDRCGRGTIGDEAHLAQECRRVHLGKRLTLPIGPVLEDLDATLQQEHQSARTVALVHEWVAGNYFLADRSLGKLLDLLRAQPAKQQVHSLS